MRQGSPSAASHRWWQKVLTLSFHVEGIIEAPANEVCLCDTRWRCSVGQVFFICCPFQWKANFQAACGRVLLVVHLNNHVKRQYMEPWNTRQWRLAKAEQSRGKECSDRASIVFTKVDILTAACTCVGVYVYQPFLCCCVFWCAMPGPGCLCLQWGSTLFWQPSLTASNWFPSPCLSKLLQKRQF